MLEEGKGGGEIETRFAFLEVDEKGADLENEYSSTKKTGLNFKEVEGSNLVRIVNEKNGDICIGSKHLFMVLIALLLSIVI